MKLRIEKKANRYFTGVPVSNWEQAKLLGSETNWIILETLRDAGIEGLTAETVALATEIPKSTVYNTLSKLQAAGLVASRTKRRGKWGRPRKENQQRLGGKPTKVYFETVEWGEVDFEGDFYESLEPLLENYEDKLKKVWLTILGEIINKYKTDEELSEFFPKDKICEKCKSSHEATNFVWAINVGLIGKLVHDDDFEELARKHHFMR